MEPQTAANNWVQMPKYSKWGFKAPKAEFVKIVIDLRSKESQATYDLPPEGHGPSLRSMLSEYQQAKATNSSYLGSLKIIITNSQQNLQTGGQLRIPGFPVRFSLVFVFIKY